MFPGSKTGSASNLDSIGKICFSSKTRRKRYRYLLWLMVFNIVTYRSLDKAIIQEKE